MPTLNVTSIISEEQRVKFFLIGICIALVLLVMVIYWPVKECDFITYDDNIYVYENSDVQSGLNWNSIKQAFSAELSTKTAFWHPITWLSLMLDYQIFGLNPHGYHLVNLCFHILNTIFLILIFHRMTGALWQSIFVAALFAIHPLHVESVAWIAERKDVLSAFFWILTLGAYIFYIERPGFWRYWLILLFFILGLMAKPMLVTLPCVLLLLDYWPLQRFQKITSTEKIQRELSKPVLSDKQKTESKEVHKVKSMVKTENTVCVFKKSLIIPLLWEKIPLIALSSFSCIITYIAEYKFGAIQSIEKIPMYNRIANAFISYIIYIAKTIYPANLAVFYPYSTSQPIWQVLGAMFLIISLTLIVIWRAKKYPYLAIGWLWYVISLIPVIGIVQVGLHARADRYTYIPLIGLFIMAAWGIQELLKTWCYRKATLVTLFVLSLLCLSIDTRMQVGYWQKSITLFDHALKVTDGNKVAYINRAIAYGNLGEYDLSISDFNEAIELDAADAGAYYNRAISYYLKRDYQKAWNDIHKSQALGFQINPQFLDALIKASGKQK